MNVLILILCAGLKSKLRIHCIGIMDETNRLISVVNVNFKGLKNQLYWAYFNVDVILVV